MEENPEGFNPEDQSLIQAIMQGNPADAIIKAKDIDDWIIKLHIVDFDEATLGAMTLSKCLENKRYGQAQAQEVMRLLKMRSAEGGKQIHLFADVVSGIMAMALRHRQDRNDSNERSPR